MEQETLVVVHDQRQWSEAKVAFGLLGRGPVQLPHRPLATCWRPQPGLQRSLMGPDSKLFFRCAPCPCPSPSPSPIPNYPLPFPFLFASFHLSVRADRVFDRAAED